MSRLSSSFMNSHKLLVPFITCGDPNANTTVAVAVAAAQAGADAVVLGIPFSDPTVEGPVVRASSVRALEQGATTAGALAIVDRIRQQCDIPLILGSYANVVLSYGIEQFAQDAAAAGADGVVLQDVPFEERDEFAPILENAGIELIRQVSPAALSRIPMVVSNASGFIWCAAELGGAPDNEALEAAITMTRSESSLPIVVEAGVSTSAEVAEIVQMADGVVVPAAVDALLTEYGDHAAEPVASLIAELAQTAHEI